jgi:hypothetical protein
MMIIYNHEETHDQNANRISQNLTATMERTTTKYEKLLYVAGGDLNLAKGHCYILTWRWDTKGTATMTTIEETPGEIYLTHGRDTTREKNPRKKRTNHAKRSVATQHLTEDTKDNTRYSRKKRSNTEQRHDTEEQTKD